MSRIMLLEGVNTKTNTPVWSFPAFVHKGNMKQLQTCISQLASPPQKKKSTSVRPARLQLRDLNLRPGRRTGWTQTLLLALFLLQISSYYQRTRSKTWRNTRLLLWGDGVQVESLCNLPTATTVSAENLMFRSTPADRETAGGSEPCRSVRL